MASDPDGEVVSVEIDDAPLGARAGNDIISWQPITAGTFTLAVTVTDDDGLTWQGDVTLRSTFPARPGLLAMGDSVPAGHGLDIEDYLELDPCWRSDAAYPNQVHARLVNAGVLNADAAVSNVSCSGYFTWHLWERQVTGGFSEPGESADRTRTQLDWAVRANPDFITVTIGANNTGFVGPERLFTDELMLDLEQVDQRLGRIRTDMAFLLERLLQGTDSTIVVTNYYDPTADNPQGIEGCRTSCFSERSGFVVRGMNDAIEDSVRSYDGTDFSDRLVFVPLDELFVGHAAPNGLGPDGFRAAGFGAVGDLLNIQVAEIHPYCARGETTGEPWVNSIDCVHPNKEGHRQMAAAVAAAIIESSG